MTLTIDNTINTTISPSINLNDHCYLFNKTSCFTCNGQLAFRYWAEFTHDGVGLNCNVSLDASPSFMEFLMSYLNSNEGREHLHKYFTIGSKTRIFTSDECYDIFTNSDYSHEDSCTIASKYVDLITSINPMWVT